MMINLVIFLFLSKNYKYIDHARMLNKDEEEKADAEGQDKKMQSGQDKKVQSGQDKKDVRRRYEFQSQKSFYRNLWGENFPI